MWCAAHEVKGVGGPSSLDRLASLAPIQWVAALRYRDRQTVRGFLCRFASHDLCARGHETL